MSKFINNDFRQKNMPVTSFFSLWFLIKIQFWKDFDSTCLRDIIIHHHSQPISYAQQMWRKFIYIFDIILHQLNKVLFELTYKSQKHF